MPPLLLCLNVYGGTCSGSRTHTQTLVYWIAKPVYSRGRRYQARGSWGFGRRDGGGVNWVKGYKRGQFTDNLGPRWTIPVTSGGSQVSGRGHKGELARGARGARGTKGGALCIYVTQCVCQND
jgi:hypothetical protein